MSVAAGRGVSQTEEPAAIARTLRGLQTTHWLPIRLGSDDTDLPAGELSLKPRITKRLAVNLNLLARSCTKCRLNDCDREP